MIGQHSNSQILGAGPIGARDLLRVGRCQEAIERGIVK
jgi:hypothetical protein